MADERHDQAADRQEERPPEPRARRPYRPPAIDLEDHFERQALGCSVAIAPKMSCLTNRMS